MLSKICTFGILCLLTLQNASAINIAGFYNTATGNAVEQHLRIDLDIKEMNSAMKNEDYQTATSRYQDGKNSIKDPLRRIQGFSEALEGKINGGYFAVDTEYNVGDILKNWHKNDTLFGDKFVQEGLLNGALEAGARRQISVKGAQYQVVMPYVLYELYKAQKLCLEDTKAEKNWDEGAAFYAGSLMVDADSQSDRQSGTLHMTLAAKRAGAFDTFSTVGTDEKVATANYEAFKAFVYGRNAISEGNCAEAQQAINTVRKNMIIALVQGTLQYAVKGSAPGASQTTKAEAWAFAAAALPYINVANSTSADIVLDEMNYFNEETISGNGTNTVNASVLQNKATPVFNAIFAALPDMCITCSEIGVLNAGGKGDSTEILPSCPPSAETLSAACQQQYRSFAFENQNTEACTQEEAEIPPAFYGAVAALVAGLMIMVATADYFRRKAQNMASNDATVVQHKV